MKNRRARFQVSSRLASLLSQEYSSTEKALKELVDNAWDADAENVSITLPAPMSDAPIVIDDDGTGMTAEEVRRHYLAIAADRRVARGERTAGKNRRVKGRKGIGKFAGLMVAAEMTVETRARSRLSAFTVRLSDLAQIDDIEKLPIDIQDADCDASDHGTRITLSGHASWPCVSGPREAQASPTSGIRS
ncbi:ATP-binding protein [Hydrogenophaga sp. UC242_50]|uniref:ATP-binding protein n=1 Tax=unclassified Hydrogenophaga TaxID=2610897 RepID=UPI0036D34953